MPSALLEQIAYASCGGAGYCRLNTNARLKKAMKAGPRTLFLVVLSLVPEGVDDLTTAIGVECDDEEKY